MPYPSVASRYSSPARFPRRATLPYSFEGPLTINDSTQTVNGVVVIDGRNFTSNSATVGAVVINTAKDVVIQNCRILAPYGIQKNTNGGKVSVYNCLGRTTNPNVAAGSPAQFMNLNRPSAVDVQHCEWDGNGILINGVNNFDASNDAVRIKYNKGRNVLGLISDGYNGWVFEAANTANTYFKQRQHIQLDGWGNVQGTSFPNEIAWNEFRNDPLISRVEDNINFSNSGGTSSAPIEFQNNFIRGAFNTRLWDLIHYSGGGVITEGTCAWINLDDNIVLQTHQYGLGFVSGTNLNARRNFIVSSTNEQGVPVAYQNVGIQNQTYTSSGQTNLWDSNTIGWGGGNWAVSGLGPSSGTTNTTTFIPSEYGSATDSTTLPFYEAMWQAKLANLLATQGITIGATISW